eukprot:g63860.t1
MPSQPMSRGRSLASTPPSQQPLASSADSPRPRSPVSTPPAQPIATPVDYAAPMTNEKDGQEKDKEKEKEKEKQREKVEDEVQQLLPRVMFHPARSPQ